MLKFAKNILRDGAWPGLLMTLTVGCTTTHSRLARQVEASPSYQRLIALRPDASWEEDYTLGDYTRVAIGAPMDENFWHRWETLRIWRSGRIECLVICPECKDDEQWVEDK